MSLGRGSNPVTIYQQLADVMCVLFRAGQNLHLEHDIPFGTAKIYLGLGFPCR